MDDQPGAGRGTCGGGQVELDKAADLGIGELIDDRGTYDEECKRGKERDGNEGRSER